MGTNKQLIILGKNDVPQSSKKLGKMGRWCGCDCSCLKVAWCREGGFPKAGDTVYPSVFNDSHLHCGRTVSAEFRKQAGPLLLPLPGAALPLSQPQRKQLWFQVASRSIAKHLEHSLIISKLQISHKNNLSRAYGYC